MPSEVNFRTTNGRDPVERVLKIRKAIEPTEGDLLYAGQRQRARILERTERGVDVDEAPFAPYSTKGPHYYNPTSGQSAIFTEKQAGRVHAGKTTFKRLWQQKERGAARRFLNKITTKEQRGKKGAPGLSRTGRTIRFESYAAFKRWLGRTTVDLRSARAPHMLQGIIVKVAGLMSGSDRDEFVSPTSRTTPATELVLGIYGEAADRATGHNTGDNAKASLPKRHFFGASAADARLMLRDIYERMKIRMQR
ncbi:MAG: hypothetical protein ACM3S5_05830 [Rhodospirillales bacterium]